MDVRTPVMWAIMVLALLISIQSTVSGSLERIDRLNTDMYHVLAGVRHQPTATLIASIDTDALNFYPNTPLVFWGPHFAKAIARLKQAGAAAIALDIYFAITPEQWLRTLENVQDIPREISDYDQTFDQELAEGRVILAANPIIDPNNRVSVPWPADEYLMALPNHLGNVGLTTLQTDSDTRVRWMVLAHEGLATDGKSEAAVQVPEGYQPPQPWWTFAALAVREGFGAEALPSSENREIFTKKRIAYCGPPLTIPRISLAALFRDQGLTVAEKALIRGRIVFIGADSETLNDQQATPYSRRVLGSNHRDMSRVEIHANIAETIRNPEQIKEVPAMIAFTLWAAVMALAVFSCSSHLKTIAIYISKVSSLLLLWPLGFFLFKWGYILPQAGCLSSITLFFIIMATLRTVCTSVHCRQIAAGIVGETFYMKIYNHNPYQKK